MCNEVKTAIIRSTELGFEDHGILTCFLYLEGDGWGCGFGGFSLQNTSTKFISQILSTFEVNTWEKLKDLPCRCVIKDHSIEKIGHFVKDKWFSFKEYFEAERSITSSL